MANPDPRASRPDMPDYGLAPATGGEGLLPWSWARERLERTRNYPLVTVRPDGAPHLAPVWGVWFEDAFYFSTAPSSRKARNFMANARCVVTTDDAQDAVIVEGTVGEVRDAALNARIVAAYNQKYSWNYGAGEPFYVLRPRRVFGFIENSDGPDTGDFAATATRWTFAG